MPAPHGEQLALLAPLPAQDPKHRRRTHDGRCRTQPGTEEGLVAGGDTPRCAGQCHRPSATPPLPTPRRSGGARMARARSCPTGACRDLPMQHPAPHGRCPAQLTLPRRAHRYLGTPDIASPPDSWEARRQGRGVTGREAMAGEWQRCGRKEGNVGHAHPVGTCTPRWERSHTACPGRTRTQRILDTQVSRGRRRPPHGMPRDGPWPCCRQDGQGVGGSVRARRQH